MAEIKNQRQDSTIDQLRDLIPIANKNGMYDAADYLKAIVAKSELQEESFEEKIKKVEKAIAMIGTAEFEKMMEKEMVREGARTYWRHKK